VNTHEIECFLSPRLSTFDGVFSIDTLPSLPRLLVCNTDPASKPGHHWVAIHVHNGRGEFFDSFGRALTATFERCMNRYCSSWIFNQKQLQSVISKFCGYYCLLRDRDVDMRKIVRNFTDDTGLYDALVHAFLCTR